jgi:hypothetical protein
VPSNPTSLSLSGRIVTAIEKLRKEKKEKIPKIVADLSCSADRTHFARTKIIFQTTGQIMHFAQTKIKEEREGEKSVIAFFKLVNIIKL